MDRIHTLALMAATIAAKDGVSRGPLNKLQFDLYALHAVELLEAVEREVSKRLTWTVPDPE